jgi:hypothetical protein
MSVRVNLLQPEERHLYSAVGRTFIVKVAVVAAAAVAALFIVLAGYNLRTVVGGLGAAKDRWAEIEQPYAHVVQIRDELDQHTALEDELVGWAEGRVDWLGPLEELQALAPTNVQLTSLNVSSRLLTLEEERRPGAKKGVKPPERLARVFSVRLDGKAFGGMADGVVTRFVDELRRAPTMEPWLESLGLQGLQRAAQRNAEGDEWIFRIEAESSPRILQ